tara:strand:+ start:172 stop:375 length:204 start_codon:yes stop_codon:yes gene_type:complete
MNTNSFQRRRSLPVPATVDEAVEMLISTYTREKFDRLDERLTAAGFDWCDFDYAEYQRCLRHRNYVR